jgi:hypothetical protein
MIGIYFPAWIFYEMPRALEYTYTHYKEPEAGWNKFSDFHITIVGALVSYILQIVVDKVAYNFFYTYCKEKDDEELRIAKSKKACYSFYKGLYFIIVTIWGYLILKDEKFIPPELMGRGSVETMNVDFPTIFLQHPHTIRYYYLGTLGYHVH